MNTHKLQTDTEPRT